MRRNRTLSATLWLSCALAPLLAACDGRVDHIREQRDLWVQSNVRDYVFVMAKLCFCFNMGEVVGNRIQVENGVAVSMVGVSTGQPYFVDENSVDSLFERAIDVARFSDARIEFDTTTHVPTRIETGGTGALDDELSIQVSCFSKDPRFGCPIHTLTSQECTGSNGVPTPLASIPLYHICLSGGSLGRITDQDEAICCVEGRTAWSE